MDFLKYLGLDPVAKGVLLGTLSSLCGILLQTFLTKKQVKNQSLAEARRIVYARLLSAIEAEESYPYPHSFEATEEYNDRLQEWRKNRKAIKGLAAEALLLAQDQNLKEKLTQFISSSNPEERLFGVTQLMQDEIEL